MGKQVEACPRTQTDLGSEVYVEHEGCKISLNMHKANHQRQILIL